jgi:hypothetical protein
MTNLQQKVAGVIALTTVSAVSLLAGGIILGSASADDGNAPTTSVSNLLSIAPANLQAGEPGSGLKAGCVISLARPVDGAAEPATLKVAPGLNAISIEGANGEMTKSLRIVTADGEVLTGDDLPDAVFSTAVEAKPLSPEEIEELKASGALSSITPEDCKVVNEDGSVTLPDGTVVTPDADGNLTLPDGTTVKIGKPGSGPFTIEFKAP